MLRSVALMIACAGLALATGQGMTRELSAATVDRAAAPGRCMVEAFLPLPDLRFTAATSATSPVSHCVVTGVIGTETNFELLLPEDWNGKFVMGGGGGFVGGVINTALGYGVLQKGFATVGTQQ